MANYRVIYHDGMGGDHIEHARKRQTSSTEAKKLSSDGPVYVEYSRWLSPNTHATSYMTPSNRGYANERARIDSGEKEDKYKRFKKRVNELANEYVQLKRNIEAVQRNYSGQKKDVPEQVKQKVAEFQWKIANNVQLSLALINEFPALKTEVPEWYRKILNNTKYIPLKV